MPSQAWKKRLVVVGASLAGLRAIESARRSGFDGDITLIGMEEHLPYDRPPLSKAFLQDGSRTPLFRPQEYYTDELKVSLLLGQAATSLEPNERIVKVGAREVPYDALVLATGAVPRTIPAWEGIPGVQQLRTIDDAEKIREAIQSNDRIAIIGAGFIGSEIASSARKNGNQTTIIEAMDVPLVRAVGPIYGAALSAMHHRNGTDLRCSTTTTQIAGIERPGRPAQILTFDDGTSLETDLVLVGIGARPATDWLLDSGVALDRDGGVVCDEFLQTSLPGVYAAGDIVRWPNAIMDEVMRLENWTSAAEQGSIAGSNAVTEAIGQKYETVPYFWSDWYGNRIQFVGKANGDDAVVVSGDINEDKFIVLYRNAGRIIGALTVNEPTRIMKYRRLIARQASWDDALKLENNRQKTTTS